MQEAVQRFPRMHAPHPPGRGIRGSDRGAADANRKLQRAPDGHVRNHRQVRDVFHPAVCILDVFGFIMQTQTCASLIRPRLASEYLCARFRASSKIRHG